MDDQLPVPVAASDADAKVAEIALLADNARNAAAVFDNALSDIEAKKSAAAQAAAQVDQLLVEASNAKTAAEEAFAENKLRVEQLSSSVAAREEAILGQLTSIEERVNNRIAELEQAAGNSQSKVDHASSEVAQRTSTRLGELEAAVQKAASEQQNATVNAGHVAASLTQAHALLAEIEGVKNAVIAHQAITAEAVAGKQRFDAEAATLLASETDRYQRTFADIQQLQKSLTETSVEFGREIQRLTAAAEAMLFGSTNAGLGAVFKEEVKACDRSIAFCTVMFLIGMIGLGASIIPLITYMSNVAAGHELTLADVVARGLVVLPASWFCLHFARRLHASIELRQNWVHKFTVAATVEPFRQQAGEHAAASVLAALEQLMKNPASVLRRHKRMSDPPTDAVAEAARPMADGLRKALSGSQQNS